MMRKLVVDNINTILISLLHLTLLSPFPFPVLYIFSLGESWKRCYFFLNNCLLVARPSGIICWDGKSTWHDYDAITGNWKGKGKQSIARGKW